MGKLSIEIDKGERQRFIDEVLDREWEMFQAVKSASPAACQDSPDAFRKVRGSIFQFWPRTLLSAYLIELTAAKRKGRNLLAEKFARMDNLIPPINSNPIINKIVDIETEWQQEIKERYPALYQRSCRSTEEADNGMSFSVYLRCELETYGNSALGLYHEWVENAKRSGMNYSLAMLNHIVLNSGFDNIDEAESFWGAQLQ